MTAATKIDLELLQESMEEATAEAVRLIVGAISAQLDAARLADDLAEMIGSVQHQDSTPGLVIQYLQAALEGAEATRDGPIHKGDGRKRRARDS